MELLNSISLQKQNLNFFQDSLDIYSIPFPGGGMEMSGKRKKGKRSGRPDSDSSPKKNRKRHEEERKQKWEKRRK